MSQPEFQPASFLTLEPGTCVVDRFGKPVGTVERVLLFEGDGFDGIIVETSGGRRFVDAPEVRRISGGAVTLGVACADVEDPGPNGPRNYGVPVARHTRTEVTEADRDDCIEALKSAYVAEHLTTDELAERVGIVHVAETLDQLDAVLRDC